MLRPYRHSNQHRDQIAVGIPCRQWLVKDPTGLGVFCAHREMRVEQGRRLPEQQLERTAAPGFGRKSRPQPERTVDQGKCEGPLTICGRPLSGKGKRWGRCCAWSDAVICPAFDAAERQPPACMGVRGPGPDHPKRARSTVESPGCPSPVSPTVTPYSPSARPHVLAMVVSLRRRSRSSVGATFDQQGPDDAGQRALPSRRKYIPKAKQFRICRKVAGDLLVDPLCAQPVRSAEGGS